jgi:hypothetical protein
MPEQTGQAAANLHWLATLLTGHREIAADVTVEAFASGGAPDALSRKGFIAKALAAVREDLAASAQRTALRWDEDSALPPLSWALDRKTTKSELEQAFLSIEMFPRAAALLLLFERVPLNDAAILLDSEPGLVCNASATGARDLTINLARMQESVGRQYA